MFDSSKDSVSPYQAFELVDMRVGRVTRVEDHARARKPAYKLWIDFGPELGIKTSTADTEGHVVETREVRVDRDVSYRELAARRG